MRASPEVFRRLERLQELSKAANASDVVRDALAVYERILETLDDGGEFILRKGNDEKSFFF